MHDISESTNESTSAQNRTFSSKEQVTHAVLAAILKAGYVLSTRRSKVSASTRKETLWFQCIVYPKQQACTYVAISKQQSDHTYTITHTGAHNHDPPCQQDNGQGIQIPINFLPSSFGLEDLLLGTSTLMSRADAEAMVLQHLKETVFKNDTRKILLDGKSFDNFFQKIQEKGPNYRMLAHPPAKQATSGSDIFEIYSKNIQTPT
jgi:hypothetical protein